MPAANLEVARSNPISADERFLKTNPNPELQKLVDFNHALYDPEHGDFTAEVINPFVDWLLDMEEGGFLRIFGADGQIALAKETFIESFVKYKNMCAFYKGTPTKDEKANDVEPSGHWACTGLYGLDGKNGVGRAWGLDGVGQPHGLPYMISREVDGVDIEEAALQLWDHMEDSSIWPASLHVMKLEDDAAVNAMEAKLDRLDTADKMDAEMRSYFAGMHARRIEAFELQQHLSKGTPPSLLTLPTSAPSLHYPRLLPCYPHPRGPQP